MKKLALMGMTAGMLLSVEQVNANFENYNSSGQRSYLAGKCGNKCGGGKVADNGRSGCGGYQDPSYGNHGCNGRVYYEQSNHGCSSYELAPPANHGCQAQTQYQQQPSGHQCGGSHGCGGAPASTQGYYNPNQAQPQTNANQQTTNDTTQNSNKINSKAPKADANSKYQASGCGGKNKCGGETNNNGQNYQANGCGGNRNPNTSNGLNASYYYNPNQVAEADTKVTPPQLNASGLEAQLNDQGKSTFKRLSPEGQKLALELANGECKGKNECKGLNSCKGDNNACAGKGGCKHQGSALFTDKNAAVKVAAAKMAEKRGNLQNK